MTDIQPELWVDTPREALRFYEAAFGATVLHCVGEGDDIVAQLGVGDAAFWVAPASSTMKRLSPRALDGAATSRTLLVVDDPDSIVAKRRRWGNPDVRRGRRARLAARPDRRPVRSRMGDRQAARVLAAFLTPGWSFVGRVGIVCAVTAAAAARETAVGFSPRWRPIRNASATPAAQISAISNEDRARPAASASAADAPAAVWLSIAVVETVAAAATNSDPPTYRAMFEMPEACPTWLSGTADVDAEDAGSVREPEPGRDRDQRQDERHVLHNPIRRTPATRTRPPRARSRSRPPDGSRSSRRSA